MLPTPTHRTIDALWRMESGRIIAGVARLVRDVGLAEELAHDALVAALEQWPTQGVPEQPGAWLMTTARRRAIDWLRRRKLQQRKHEELSYHWDEADADTENISDETIEDSLLRLIFTTCHPALPTDSRVALTLKLLAGLTTGEIARAFLSTEPTIAQRIVRAKRTLADENIPFEVPQGEEQHERLASVLEVIYLLFNEGYAATTGDDLIRPALCEEAQRLGRILAELMPREAEVQGLIALLELQASRLKTRTNAQGEPVLLMDQNRARWDQLLIRRGLEALARGKALQQSPGIYLLQAEIAACHARARTPGETDWKQIAAYYDILLEVYPSPIVALNRAVAIGMAYGPQVALPLVEELEKEPLLAGFHLVASVRGDLLEKLHRFPEASLAYEQAASQTRNEKERQQLLQRAKTCTNRFNASTDQKIS
ncbi:MAG: RNA polymerase sigma factor [Planctomycetia bacterium]|nr:RNA polymerase sigma factor [Planctomycetia bacterium]